MMPIVFGVAFNNRLSIMNPTPMVPITLKKNTLKCISNHNPKLISVNSSTINHSPLVSRNFLAAVSSCLLFMDKKADVPDKKTKVGAHKCVIQRVANKAVVVVFKFVGDCVMEVVCKRSRT